MIKSNIRPRGRSVTIFTDIGCRHMHGRLAGCGRSVMAAKTGAGDAGMIKPDAGPAHRVMAIVAAI